jgi:outer membrane protein assembly factor BamA
MKQIYRSLLLLCLLPVWLGAQAPTKSPNRFKIIGLPVFFYTPDTKFGGGAGGLSTFNFPSDSLNARRSSVTVGAVYTQLKQVLLYFPFQLFPQNQRYWISGEVGYYRYIFNFFGTGNDIPSSFIEKYDATFPRLRLNASRQLRPGLYAGVRYAFDRFSFQLRDSTGLLIREDIVGYNGGTVSGAGLGMNYDTRDVLFFPRKGWLIDAQLYAEDKLTGSDFKYQRFAADVAHYVPVGKKSVLALNAVAVVSVGEVPFHQMPVIGGTRRMRGYFEGKYRDNNLFMLQSEYRMPLFWRIGAVAFGGLGVVSRRLGDTDLEHLRYNYGAGIRIQIDKVQKINVRLDYGLGYRSRGFYLTFGEAF